MVQVLYISYPHVRETESDLASESIVLFLLLIYDVYCIIVSISSYYYVHLIWME